MLAQVDRLFNQTEDELRNAPFLNSPLMDPLGPARRLWAVHTLSLGVCQHSNRFTFSIIAFLPEGQGACLWSASCVSNHPQDEQQQRVCLNLINLLAFIVTNLPIV